MLFSRQDKILDILDTTILILYRKLYINVVSIIVLNIEVMQYKIKINLAISCSSSSILKKIKLYNDVYFFFRECKLWSPNWQRILYNYFPILTFFHFW